MARRIHPLLPVLILFGLGCSDDPTGRIAPPEGYAASPDEAVRLLRDAFQQIDADAMARVLHPDFEFELSVPDAALLDLGSGGTWDRTTHLAWCGNLFGGRPGIRTDGVLQNPLDVDFGLTGLWVSEADGWTAIPTGPLAGTQRRTYGGVWSIQYTGGDFDFVQGEQTFHVRSREATFPEGVATVYEVRHWYSETVPPAAVKKHETISWGLLIAKFRFSQILDPPAGYAANADEAVSLLQQAYEDLDAELLGRVLHPAFEFQLDAGEASEFSQPELLDRETFTWWTLQMFSGNPGSRADGTDQPGLDPSSGLTGPWTEVDAGWTLVSQGPYLQTLERRYEGAWTAAFTDASLESVDGVQTFNVVEGVVEVDGALARLHQLRRWASSPPASPTAVSWGRLTAWYRSPNPLLR